MNKILLSTATIITLLCLSSVASAVALEVHSNAVNLGNHWFSNEQSYWGMDTDEFNVFTVTEQTDGDEDYVALFCPQAFVDHGIGLKRIAKINNTDYEIHDACVAADRRLWVATSNGLFRSNLSAYPDARWINDTDAHYVLVASGCWDRLRFDSNYVYGLSFSGDCIYLIDYDTLSPIKQVDLSSILPACQSIFGFFVDGTDIYSITARHAGGDPTIIHFYENENLLFNTSYGYYSMAGGSLHLNQSGFFYWSLNDVSSAHAQMNNIYDPFGVDVGDWASVAGGFDQHVGCCIYGFYGNQGLYSYNTAAGGGGTWYISTFLTEFDYPLIEYEEEEKYVEITGIVYDALNMTVVSNANISILQTSQYYNKTSNATGAYNVTLLSDIPFYVNVTKTGYIHEDFSVTALWVGDYTMDLYLLPVQSGVYGLVVEYPWHQAIDGANVSLWNATYNNSTTSNLVGFYEMSSMADGYYDMNASATDYVISSDENVSVSGGVAVQSFVLSGIYNLTVQAENSKTGAPIASFMATIDSKSQSTETGSTVFSLGYGLYVVTVSATGFYSNAAYAYVNENEIITVSLTPEESAYYSTHYTSFTVKNFFGTRYPDVQVKCFSLGNTSETFNGTTDSDGTAVFKLSENVKYQLNFTDGTWSKNISLYPRETHYTVWRTDNPFIPDVTDDSIHGAVNYIVTKGTYNDTHAWLEIEYNDTSNLTTSFYSYINTSDDTEYTNETINDTAVLTSILNITGYTENTYIIGFNAQHEAFGTIEKRTTISFPGTTPRIDLGLDTWTYNLLSIFIIIFVAGMFTTRTVSFGAITMCITAWVLYYIQWFPGLSTVFLTGATLVAILYYIRERETALESGGGVS